ncbi:Uncharacterised protein [Listeria booriae]|nr:Uncharacterised protein [Listeria booriae]
MNTFAKIATIGVITVAGLFGASTLASADTTTSTGKITLEADDSPVTPSTHLTPIAQPQPLQIQLTQQTQGQETAEN